MYRIYNEVPQEYYSHVQQLIDLSYPLERTLSRGNIHGNMDQYSKTLDIAKNLLPQVKDHKLQTNLSDHIRDFEELVGQLRSSKKSGHTTRTTHGLLNNISDNVATTVGHVVGAVQDAVEGIIDGVFNILNFGRNVRV